MKAKAELLSETQYYVVVMEGQEDFSTVVVVEHDANIDYTDYSIVSGEPADWDYRPYVQEIKAAAKRAREEG